MNRILYNYINIIYNFIINISYNRFAKRKLPYHFVVPNVQTYGDFPLFYEYTRLKKKVDNVKYTILAIENLPAKDLLKYFFPQNFNNENFFFYNEKIYVLFHRLIKFILIIINFFFRNKKRGNLLYVFENLMLQRLIYISKFKYYNNHKLNFEDKKIILKNIDNLNYSFIKRFIRYTNFANNNSTQCELVHLRRKYGNFDYSNNSFFSDDKKNQLLKKLGVNKKFICLFIKPYDQSYRKLNLNKEQDPRCLNDIKTLEESIKFIIKNNFDVVLVGRSDVNIFSEIGVINYASMNIRSILNDLLLYSSCEFMIGSPGGPVVYPFIFDKPCLGLNSFTLFAYNDWEKYIYHPKPLLDIKNNKIVSLNEILQNPVFFEQSKKVFNQLSLMTIDLSSEEVLSSVKDFFEMYKNNNYLIITEKHQKLKNILTEMHLGFYSSYRRISRIYLEKYLQ